MIKHSILATTALAVSVLGTTASAQPNVSGNTISWPAEGWYQVQRPSTSDWDLCNSSDDGTSCQVSPGSYRVVNHTTGMRFNVEVTADSPSSVAIRQTSDMLQNGTTTPVRGAGVLTRTADRVTLNISTLDLSPQTSYSVWLIVFNDPENCLEPNQCSGSDVFESRGVLNQSQVAAARISGVFGAGFVTGDDGVANISAEVDAGTPPAGTFIIYGWSDPVDFGPDSNAGLAAGNGLEAEIHAVIRNHGPAVAGSVGLQTTNFNGLCDVQNCSSVQAVLFRPPM